MKSKVTKMNAKLKKNTAHFLGQFCSLHSPKKGLASAAKQGLWLHWDEQLNEIVSLPPSYEHARQIWPACRRAEQVQLVVALMQWRKLHKRVHKENWLLFSPFKKKSLCCYEAYNWEAVHLRYILQALFCYFQGCLLQAEGHFLNIFSFCTFWMFTLHRRLFNFR